MNATSWSLFTDGRVYGVAFTHLFGERFDARHAEGLGQGRLT